MEELKILGEKITILGKEYDVKFPKEFPIKDFKMFLKMHKDDPFDDYFEMMDHFQAVLFMKYNKDLFIKMMVEEAVKLNKLYLLGIKNWFGRNIPLV